MIKTEAAIGPHPPKVRGQIAGAHPHWKALGFGNCCCMVIVGQYGHNGGCFVLSPALSLSLTVPRRKLFPRRNCNDRE